MISNAKLFLSFERNTVNIYFVVILRYLFAVCYYIMLLTEYINILYIPASNYLKLFDYKQTIFICEFITVSYRTSDSYRYGISKQKIIFDVFKYTYALVDKPNIF